MNLTKREAKLISDAVGTFGTREARELSEKMGADGENLYAAMLIADYECCCIAGSCDCYTSRDRNFRASTVVPCGACGLGKAVMMKPDDGAFCRDCAKRSLENDPEVFDPPADGFFDDGEEPFMLDDDRSDADAFIAELKAEIGGAL